VTIAIRNEALPQGKNGKTTKSTLAASETTPIGRQPRLPRSESHRQRCEHAHRDDQQERDAVHPAMPHGGITAAQHRHIDPKRGQDQRHPKQNEQHDCETTHPPVRQLMAHRVANEIGRLSGRANLNSASLPWLASSFLSIPTSSGPGWQDAWAMGRCRGEEAH
jgi:hypothetical protein